MNGGDPKAGKQVFRPHAVLAAIMGAATLLWLGVLVYLLRFDGVPVQTFLSAVFFVLFFAVSVTYYGRTRIIVDSGGITYRGLVRTRRFSFADIRKVDVLPGPVTVYAAIIRNLQDASVMYIGSSLKQKPELREEANHGHGDILDALESRDIEAAVKALDEHLLTSIAAYDLRDQG